jgi:transmembrane sensor
MSLNNADQKIREQAIQWLLRLSADKCTNAERQAFSKWLEIHPSHQEIYHRIEAHWNRLDRFKSLEFTSRTQALKYRPASLKRRRYLQGLAMAATVLIAIGYTTFSDRGWYGRPVNYSTTIGNQSKLQLSDGSQMELNSDTLVSVHFNRWQRAIEIIRGEAFFKVEHDANRPFVVTAANGCITDIGTAFGVYLQTEKVRVAVQEGRVMVKTEQSRELSANNVIIYQRDGSFIAQPNSDISNLTAWRQGELVFNNRRLDDVLAELGRYSKTQIHMANPSLGPLKVSGRFRLDRPEVALESIATSLSISLHRSSADRIILGNP